MTYIEKHVARNQLRNTRDPNVFTDMIVQPIVRDPNVFTDMIVQPITNTRDPNVFTDMIVRPITKHPGSECVY